MEMRRLDPVDDEPLIRQAVSWIDEQPKFYRDCDRAWGSDDADTYLRLMQTDAQADFGVFDDDNMLVAVITVSLEGHQVFNSHLMVKKGTDPRIVVAAASGVINGLLDKGLVEGWSWIARKNLGARRILEYIGMRRDGVTRFKGQSHSQPIEWQRYSVGGKRAA